MVQRDSPLSRSRESTVITREYFRIWRLACRRRPPANQWRPKLRPRVRPQRRRRVQAIRLEKSTAQNSRWVASWNLIRGVKESRAGRAEVEQTKSELFMVNTMLMTRESSRLLLTLRPKKGMKVQTQRQFCSLTRRVTRIVRLVLCWQGSSQAQKVIIDSRQPKARTQLVPAIQLLCLLILLLQYTDSTSLDMSHFRRRLYRHVEHASRMQVPGIVQVAGEYIQTLQVISGMFDPRLLGGWGVSGLSEGLGWINNMMRLSVYLSVSAPLYQGTLCLLALGSVFLLLRVGLVKSPSGLLGVASVALQKGLLMPLLDLLLDVFRCRDDGSVHQEVEMACAGPGYFLLCLACLAGVASVIVLALLSALLIQETQPNGRGSRLDVQQDVYFGLIILTLCLLRIQRLSSSILVAGFVIGSWVIYTSSKQRAFHFQEMQVHRTLRGKLIGFAGCLLLFTQFTGGKHVLNFAVLLVVGMVTMILTDCFTLDSRLLLLAQDGKTLSGVQRMHQMLCLEQLWLHRTQHLNQVWLDGHLALHRESPCKTPGCLCTCPPAATYSSGIPTYLSSQYRLAISKNSQNSNLRMQYVSFLVRNKSEKDDAVVQLNYVKEQNPGLQVSFMVYEYQKMIENLSQGRYEKELIMGEVQYDQVREMRQETNFQEMRTLLRRECRAMGDCWRTLLDAHPEKRRLVLSATRTIQCRILRQSRWNAHLLSKGFVGQKEYSVMGIYQALVLQQPQESAKWLDSRDQRVLRQAQMPFLRVSAGKIRETSEETALMLGHKKERLLNMEMDSLVASAQSPVEWGSIGWAVRRETLYLVNSLNYVQEYMVEISLEKPRESLFVFMPAPPPSLLREALLITDLSGKILYLSQSCRFILCIDQDTVLKEFPRLQSLFSLEYLRPGIQQASFTVDAANHYHCQDYHHILDTYWKLQLRPLKQHSLVVRVSCINQESTLLSHHITNRIKTLASACENPLWEFTYKKDPSEEQQNHSDQKLAQPSSQKSLVQRVEEEAKNITTVRLVNNKFTCVDYMEEQRAIEEIEEHNRTQKEKQQMKQQQEGLFQDDALQKVSLEHFHQQMKDTGGLLPLKALRRGVLIYCLTSLAMMLTSYIMMWDHSGKVGVALEQAALASQRETYCQQIEMSLNSLLLAGKSGSVAEWVVAEERGQLDRLSEQLQQIGKRLSEEQQDSAMLTSRLNHLKDYPLSQLSLSDPTVSQALDLLAPFSESMATATQLYLNRVHLAILDYRTAQITLLSVAIFANFLAALLLCLLLKWVDTGVNEIYSFFLLLPKNTLQLLLQQSEQFLVRPNEPELEGKGESTEEEGMEEEDQEEKFLIPQKKNRVFSRLFYSSSTRKFMYLALGVQLPMLFYFLLSLNRSSSFFSSLEPPLAEQRVMNQLQIQMMHLYNRHNHHLLSDSPLSPDYLHQLPRLFQLHQIWLRLHRAGTPLMLSYARHFDRVMLDDTCVLYQSLLSKHNLTCASFAGHSLAQGVAPLLLRNYQHLRTLLSLSTLSSLQQQELDVLLKDFLGAAMQSLNRSLGDNLKSLIGDFQRTSTVLFSSWLSCALLAQLLFLFPLTARIRHQVVTNRLVLGLIPQPIILRFRPIRIFIKRILSANSES